MSKSKRLRACGLRLKVREDKLIANQDSPSALTHTLLSIINLKTLIRAGTFMNRISPFIIFLTIFLTLYGLLHFFLYRKMTRAFDMGFVSNVSIIFIMGLMLFSPIISNIPGVTNHPRLSGIFSYITYTWMAFLFLFFCVNVPIDIYRTVIQSLCRIFSPNLLRALPDLKTTLIITFLIVTFILFYGFFEAKNITVETISLKTSKLPPHMKTFRIVQISDMHFSEMNGTGLAEKICKTIDDLKPDILVCTGDIMDRGLRHRDNVADLFQDINTPYGKFAVTGNHEFISGIEESVQFIEKAGFRIVRNETVSPAPFFKIIGVDDPAGQRFGNGESIPESTVIKGSSPEHLNILLKHQPRIDKDSLGKFDIQLSGHTHKGQIFPFTLIISLIYPYMDGLFDLGNHSYLYVSRGTGTWGPPIRFLTFPEITLIEFYPL